ncbi:hypothetical protein [Vibrio sp. HN007]|uniref:hypothetical protein n=1 Tax=Vibrio iocasae TaxID=3098914 RepID=UPI0035D4E0B6
MINIKELKLDFPKDNVLWRVQWIDGVLINKTKDVSNPLIRVQIVKHEPDAYKKFSEFSETCEIYVAVGRLPQVTLGSLWRNNERVSGDGHVRRRLTVSKATGIGKRISPLDSRKVDGKKLYYFPPFRYQFPYKEKIWKSNCSLLEHSGVEYIIPNVEIARFFYATSSYTARMLFTTDFGKAADKLIYKKSSKLYGPERMFVLRKEAYDSDIKPISLLCTSHHARAAATHVYTGLQLGFISNSESYVRTFLPMDGSESYKMRVDGIWLEDNKRFLVFQIVESEFVYPDEVESIDFARYAERESTENDNNTEITRRDTPKLSSDPLPERAIQSAKAPRAGYDRQLLKTGENGFKPKIPVRKVTLPASSVEKEHSLLLDSNEVCQDEHFLSTGEGSWTEDPIRGITVIQGEDNDEKKPRSIMPQGFGAYFEAIDYIELQKPEWKMHTASLTLEYDNVDGRTLSLVPLRNKKWTGTPDDRRRLAGTTISHQGKNVVLLELERKKKSEKFSSLLVWHTSFQEMTPRLFDVFMAETICQSRWPSPESDSGRLRVWGDYLFCRVQHNFATTDKYASAVIERLYDFVFSEDELESANENTDAVVKSGEPELST